MFKLAKLLTIFVIGCLSIIPAYGKIVKEKLSKYIVFISDSKEQTPNKDGSLVIYSQVDKKQPIVVVKGLFCMEDSPKSNTNIDVRNATISFPNGFRIEAPEININKQISKDREEWSISSSSCELSDSIYTITNVKDVVIPVTWNKSDGEEWKISFIINSNKGTLTENFIPVKGVDNVISDLNLKQTQQEVSFSVLQQTEFPKIPYALSLIDVSRLSFDSGLEVDVDSNKILYTLPNGSSLKYNGKDRDYLTINFFLNDGKIFYIPGVLNLEYSNGDRFDGTDLYTSIGITPTQILKLNSLDEIQLIQGTLIKNDGEVLSYVDGTGNVLKRTLKDGEILMGYKSKYRLNYDNGHFFDGDDKDFIKNPNEFLNFTSVSDAILNNGTLMESPQVWYIYTDGIITDGQWPLADGGYVMYEDNIPISLKYPDGSYADNVSFQKNLTYTPDLRSTDYKIRSGDVHTATGKIRKYVNGDIVLETVETVDDIKLLAKIKGYEIAYFYMDKSIDISEVKTDVNKVEFIFYNNAKQINQTDFFVKVNSEYNFSYPKSHIEIWDGHINLLAQTCKVDVTDKIYYQAWNSYKESEFCIIWLYTPIKTIGETNYCKSKGLFIVRVDGHSLRDNDKILYNLSDTFIQGHNRAFKYYPPKPKKNTTKYHERGRIANCPRCDGSGQIKYWGPPWKMTCPDCGGKGWHIEHEW